MNIISWNVNGLRALVKKGAFDGLLKISPDIFCFQETKAEQSQLSEDIVGPVGYFSYFDHSRGRKGYSGVAVYSKIRSKSIEYGLGAPNRPDFDTEGRFLALHFEEFTLCNVYFPNGGGGPARLKFKLDYYDAFLVYIEGLRKQGRKVIFCGDINTAHEEIDLARPKENEKNTGFLPEERAWLDVVVDHGYVDVFRYFYPQKKDSYTYWDMKTFSRQRNVGWRIDYFFVSQDLLSRVKRVEIMSNVEGSDHCPILLELK